MIREKLVELGKEQIATPQYATLEKQLDAAGTKLDDLRARFKQNPNDLNLKVQIEAGEKDFDAIVAKMEALENSGKAFRPRAETSELSNAMTVIDSVKARIASLAESLNSGGSKWQMLGKSALHALKGAISLTARLVSGVVKLGAKLAGSAITKGFQALKTGFQKAGAALKNMLHHSKKGPSLFKQMIKAGLGIRSVYFMFRKMFAAIKEGFGNLSEYSSETKDAISGVKNQLGQLKNSFAAAFEPILTAVAPILAQLIGMLNAAMDTLGQFIAMLFGRTTYTLAKEISDALDSTAGAAGGVAEEAKEATKALSGFDQLNVLSSSGGSSSSGGGGGGGGSSGTSAADMFETAEVGSDVQDFVELIKEKIANSDFAGVGKILASKLNEQLEELKSSVSWDTIGSTISLYSARPSERASTR